MAHLIELTIEIPTDAGPKRKTLGIVNTHVLDHTLAELSLFEDVKVISVEHKALQVARHAQDVLENIKHTVCIFAQKDEAA